MTNENPFVFGKAAEVDCIFLVCKSVNYHT